MDREGEWRKKKGKSTKGRKEGGVTEPNGGFRFGGHKPLPAITLLLVLLVVVGW